MLPLVSITIASYNGEKFLAEFLDSVYSQTHKNIEVVVCDDKSTDNTIEILERYKTNYGLQYFINEQNIGFIKTFERAVSLCTGEFIALADQDDIWFPEKIETLLINIGTAGLIHSDAVLVDSDKNKIADSFTEFSNKQTKITDFRKLMFYNSVTGCTVLFHRKLLEIALPFPEKIIYHDWWLALCASKSSGIKYLDQSLILYRQHQNISGGAEQMSLKFLISGSLMKGFLKDRAYKNRKMAAWFSALKTTELSKENKIIVEDMIHFHDSFFEQKIRIRAFFIFLKYFKFLYPHYRFRTKILILLTTLKGKKY